MYYGPNTIHSDTVKVKNLLLFLIYLYFGAKKFYCLFLLFLSKMDLLEVNAKTNILQHLVCIAQMWIPCFD